VKAPSDEDVARLAARLKDARGRRVVFVSHCLLDQNVRYFGGATHAGVVEEAVQRFVREGVGVYQMPCPEQEAWGGVAKRRLLAVYGSKGTIAFRLRGVLLPMFLAHTRRVYRRLARRVADHAADFVRSGCEVIGFVGVADSPSCGVTRTLDVRRALPVVASFDLDTLDAKTFDDEVIRACRAVGRGYFVEALQKELARRGLHVPFSEHDPEATRT